MTTLYISPGACSLASHIVAKELALDVHIIKVPLRNPDSLIHNISAFGKVPALITNSGNLITENSAIIPYLADLDPSQRLIASVGSDQRAQIQSWLGFLGSEIHAGSFRIINRAADFTADKHAQENIRQYGRSKLFQNLSVIEHHLDGKHFLVNNSLSVADLYLCIFLTWYARLDAEFKDFPNLKRAHYYFSNLESVKAAQAAEALLPEGVTA